jgi:hypothetical protein
VRLEVGGIETLELSLPVEVMPPPSIGSKENGATAKSLIAGDLDDELTFTEFVVPGLIGRQECESPAK